MANFNILKAAIDAVIRANGQQEITGPILNAVLKAMVDSLGAGFELAGVATPSTNPGTPDQDVYWLAYQGGTYTNFGGAVLPTGISMLKWDGSWTSQTFFTVDDQLTPNSNNLAKSGAAFDAIMQGGVFDLSAYNGGATYANLSAAMTALNSLPAAYKRGGMSIKFVSSVDNKYIQARCMAQNFTTDVTQWQGIDEEPTPGSNNLVKSGGVHNSIVNAINSEKERAELAEQVLQDNIDNIKDETLEENRQIVNSIMENYAPVEIIGDVNNAADEEDLTSVSVEGTDILKFKDKAYNPLVYSGLGRKYLRKNIVNGVNILTQDMFNKGEVGSRVPNTNTIFVIQYNYELSEDITIPENCILNFDGGSISGEYTVTGDNTGIEAKLTKIFGTDVTVGGSWNIEEFYPEWFNAKGDGVTDDTVSIQKAIDSSYVTGVWKTKLTKYKYRTNSTLCIYTRTHLEGGVYHTTSNNNVQTQISYYGDEAAVLIRIFPGVVLRNAANINLRNIDIRHLGTAYTGYGICHWDWKNDGGYTDIRFGRFMFDNVSVSGFKYGIYSRLADRNGFTENTFTNMSLVLNVVGLYVDCETSDSWITANKFINCRLSSNRAWAVYAKGNGTTGLHNVFQNCLMEGNGAGYNYDTYSEWGCGCIYSFNHIVKNSYVESNYPRRTIAEGETIREEEELLSSTVAIPKDIVTNRECACFYGSGIIENNYLNNVFIIASKEDGGIVLHINNNVVTKNTSYSGLKGFVNLTLKKGNYSYTVININQYFRTVYNYERVFQGFDFTSETDDSSNYTSLAVNSVNIHTNTTYENNIVSKDVSNVSVYINPDSVYTTGWGTFVPMANKNIFQIFTEGAEYFRDGNYKFTIEVLGDNAVFGEYNSTRNIFNKEIVISCRGHIIKNYSARNHIHTFNNCKIYIKNAVITEAVAYANTSWLFKLYSGNTVVFYNCTFKDITMKQTLVSLDTDSKDNVFIVNNCTFKSTVSQDFAIIDNRKKWCGYKVLQYNNTFEGSTSKANIGYIPIISGDSADAPDGNVPVGYSFYDTDIKRPVYAEKIVNDSPVWIESDGAALGTKRAGLLSKKPSDASVYEDFDYFNEESGRKITYGSVVTNNELLSITAPGNSSIVVENTLVTGKKYYVKINRANTRRLYACKTNTLNTETDLLLINTYYNGDNNVIVAPDSNEYPYLYADSSTTSNVKYSFYDVVDKWFDSDGATAGVLRSGTFADKPAAADIYVGFKYFCTDKQTTEGATDGIEIIHKGNNVWVDALGRVVS